MRAAQRRYYNKRYPSDIVHLTRAKNGQFRALVGPDPEFSYIGQVPDDNGVMFTGVPVQSRGLMAMGTYTNLFTNVTPTEGVKALTAQKYCLQVFGDGASATCSYGTATVGTPLIFTASAGNTTFTPTDCAKWMLTAAGGYVYPYCPPGVTVPVTSSTTGGNGPNVPLNAKMLAALRGVTDGVEKVVNGNGDSTTGWNALVSALLSSVNGRLRATNTLTGYGKPSQAIATVIGHRYQFYLTMYQGTSTDVLAYRVGTTSGGSDVVSSTVVSSGVVTRVEFISTSTTTYIAFASSGINGQYFEIDNISIQRLLPSVMTAAARIYCGASSAEITADTNILAVRNVATDLIYLASGGVIKSSDGTNTATVTVADGWGRDIVLDIFVRTNSAGTQFQIGYLKPAETTITWGDLATYAGTFTPGTHKRTALNGVPPFWIHGDFLSKKSLADADAIRRLRYTT